MMPRLLAIDFPSQTLLFFPTNHAQTQGLFEGRQTQEEGDEAGISDCPLFPDNTADPFPRLPLQPMTF